MNENAEQMNKPSISYILDPRFPGGTSSAVAAELELVKTFASVKIYAVSTEMFSGQEAAPQLRDVLLRLNLDLIWGAGEIADDIVIFHNPSCLKYQNSLDIRIIAKHLIVVSHENFLRPGEAEAFDVGKCLGQIDASRRERSLTCRFPSTRSPARTRCELHQALRLPPPLAHALHPPHQPLDRYRSLSP